VGWHVVLPLVVNLLLGFVITVVVPALLGASLQGFVFVYPDLGYTMAISGVVAFVWVIRTVLAYFVLHGAKQSERITAQEPALAPK